MISGREESDIASGGWERAIGAQKFEAIGAPLRESPRAITTIERLIESLQDVIGQDDALVVAVTCKVLSGYKAAFVKVTACDDMAALAEAQPERSTPTPVTPKKGGEPCGLGACEMGKDPQQQVDTSNAQEWIGDEE